MDWGLRVHQILAIFDASFAYNKYGNGIKNLWLAKKKESKTTTSCDLCVVEVLSQTHTF